ncbi:MAG: lectin-like protein [Bradymonadia bacterium]
MFLSILSVWPQGCDDTQPVSEAPVDAAAPDATRTDATAPDAERPDAEVVPDADPPDAALGTAQLNEIRCQAPEGIELYVGEGGSLAGWSLQVDGVSMPLDEALDQSVVEAGWLWIDETPRDIGCGYGEVALVDPAGEIVESVSVPLIPEAMTWGRLPDGEGPWAMTAPTPGAENTAPEAPAEHWFTPGVVTPVQLQLAPGAFPAWGYRSSLEMEAELTVGEDGPAPAEVRLSGWGGRFRQGPHRPRLRVDLDHEGGQLAGIDGVYLDNMVLDRALITPLLARRVLEAFKVPVPRAGFAWLTLDDTMPSLYLLAEAPRLSHLRRVLPSTSHLYTAVGRDLSPEQLLAYGVEVGVSGDREDMALLLSILASIPEDESFFLATTDFVNWPAVARLLAAEAYLGSIDGYGPRLRGAHYHLDLGGRLDLLPDGLDRTLVDTVPLHQGVGVLMRQCMADAQCRALYDQALSDAVADLEAVDWASEAEALFEPLRPWIEMDPRLPLATEGVARAVAERVAFLHTRHAEVSAVVDCLETDTDTDEDGRRCDLDCDPERADTYVGAQEICGDGIDQDCNGVADDGVACGNCQVIEADGVTYRVCVGDYTWSQGRSLCQGLGLDLVAPANHQHRDALYEAIRRGPDRDVWVSLSDQTEEGVYVGPEGEVPGYLPWDPNQPDDAGGNEDCVELKRNGRYNDLPCTANRSALCGPPCVEDGVDADEDGYTVCQGDCDDGDPEIHPYGSETCGDGVDQDCSGIADDSPACECTPMVYAGRDYAICWDRYSFDEAVAVCQGLGMQLARMDDAATTEWLWRQGHAIRRQGYWIGLDDRDQEGAFVWPDGGRPLYAPWNSGEPNDYGSGEDCAHMLTWGPFWNDNRCSAEMGVMCSMP